MKTGGRKKTILARITRRLGLIDPQARTVLALVVAFTVMFASVSVFRMVQEYGTFRDDAQVERLRSAVFLSQNAYTRLMRAQAALDGSARAIEVDMAADARSVDVFGHIVALKRRDDLGIVGVVDLEGRMTAVTDTDAADQLASAFRVSRGASIWLATVGGSGQPRIYALSSAMGNGARIIAQVQSAALLPGYDALDEVVMLVADNNHVLSSSLGTVAGTAPLLSDIVALSPREEARLLENAATLPSRAIEYGSGADARVLSVSQVIPGLDLVLSAPLGFQSSAWLRTLFFYALMLAAPLFVAAGLSSVLLHQMRSTREARLALAESELRFRLAIEGAHCGIWDWDTASDTVYVTESLARMLNWRKAGSMKVSEFLQLVRPEDHERVRLAMRSAAGRGEVDVEFRASKVAVWLQFRGRPLSGLAGQQPGRLMGVAMDVTEQRGAQQRIRAYENRLRAALESMSESFVLWDAKRRLVLSNPKFREFFHLDEKLVKPGASYDMLGLAAQGAIASYHERAEDETSELQLADGRWLHLSERTTSDGGLVSIGTDITALKRQENQLLDSERQLRQTVSDLRKTKERLADLANKYEKEKIRAEEANRSKSEFLANMSHELRTPLNAINGFSEIMSEEMFGPLGDQRYREYATDILHSGQHLLDLINDILDMSKIEAGKMNLSLEEIDPRVVIEQCARLMRGRAREAGLEVVLDIDDTPRIEADARALKQVLLNLTSNAIKFTPEGGRVTICLRAHPDYLSFQVQDTGIGIAREELPRLGQPFEQIESQHSKAHQGTGLGLALSKSLVELHGGRLMIDSDLGKGTIVSFTVPYDRQTVGADTPVAVTERASPVAPAPAPTAPPAPPPVPAMASNERGFARPEAPAAREDIEFDFDAPEPNEDVSPVLEKELRRLSARRPSSAGETEATPQRDDVAPRRGGVENEESLAGQLRRRLAHSDQS